MCSINKTLDELIKIAKAQISTSDGPYVTAPDRAYLTVRACSEVRWAIILCAASNNEPHTRKAPNGIPRTATLSG